MPEVSRFLGIIIALYYKEHEPPHFHAKYGAKGRSFRLRTCASWRDRYRRESFRSCWNGRSSTGPPSWKIGNWRELRSP